MTYVLSTIGDRTYLISESQYAEITRYIEQGSPKAFKIGRSLIVLHQITGIDPLETYHRQMKTKLAAKSLRQCRRCMTVLPINDKCPCKEQPEKFPDILSVARQENPALDQHLTSLAQKMSLPPAA